MCFGPIQSIQGLFFSFINLQGWTEKTIKSHSWIVSLEMSAGSFEDNSISNCAIMKGGTQRFPRHEVSDKQEVLFEDVSPSTAFSIRQLDTGQEFSGYIKREEKKNGLLCTKYGKERKKLVQVLLAICHVRCVNEMRACVC